MDLAITRRDGLLVRVFVDEIQFLVTACQFLRHCIQLDGQAHLLLDTGDDRVQQPFDLGRRQWRPNRQTDRYHDSQRSDRLISRCEDRFGITGSVGITANMQQTV